MIPIYNPNIGSRYRIPIDPIIGSQDMIPIYDPNIGCQYMIPIYDPNI